MGHYAKLKCGSAELNLNDPNGPYGLAPMFVPPEMANAPPESGLPDVPRGYNLPLQVSGSTGGQTHGAVRQLDRFIAHYLKRREPLYLVYGPSDALPYEPKWGQLFYYFEITSRVGAGLGGDYGIGTTRATRLDVNLALELGSAALGLPQTAGRAKGGVLEDTLGTAGKQSRGLIIPPAARNYVLNPIFGAATFNDDWTDGSGVDSYENTNTEFVLFGEKSAKIVAHGASGRYFRASVDLPAEVCVFSCYAIKEDKSAITASDLVLVYDGGGLTETYVEVGHGFYRVYARGTGTGAPANFDINFGANVCVYLAGVQVEATNYPTPVIYGDLPGCAWDGTAHTDESTRDAAQYYVTDPVDIAQGSILTIWKAAHAESLYDGNIRIFVTEDSNYDCYYNVTSNEFAFTDGTNTVAVSAAVAAGDIFFILATWRPDGLALYVNDSSDTDSSYALPTAVPDYLYLGRTAGGAGYSGGTYLDLLILSQPLSATEVAAAYTDFEAHYNGGDGLGQRLNPIPWHWTTGGDDVYDNCDDSSRQNWGLVGGVPGSLPADTEYLLTPGQTLPGGAALAVQPYRSDFDRFKAEVVYEECAGYTDGGATDSGGTVSRESLGTTLEVFGEEEMYVWYSDQKDRNHNLFFRIKDAGSDLQGRIAIRPYTGDYLWTTDWVDIDPPSGSYRVMKLGPTYLARRRHRSPNLQLAPYGVSLELKRTTGTGYVYVDYQMILPEPTAYVAGPLAVEDYSLRDKSCLRVQFGFGQYNLVKRTVLGQNIDLYPQAINYMHVVLDLDEDNNNIADTLTVGITVTPRWSLL